MGARVPLWAGRAAVLALAAGLAAAVGSAAGDKPLVWRPIVPAADTDDLVKYLGQVLQDDLSHDPPKGLVQKDWEDKIRSTGLLVAILAESTKEGKADQLAGLRATGVDLSEAVAKGQLDAAKAKAAALASLKGEATAQAQPADLADKAELADLMNLLRLRGKGGLGFGLKPTPPPISDGIEARLITLAQKQLKPADLMKQADDIARSAYIMAAVSEVADAHTPEKKVAGKDPKDWKQWTDDMREGALQLAAAARSGKPADVRAAANKLNSSCNNCHEVFRQ